MRLSTSINLMDAVCGEFGQISAEECLRRCRQAGFRVMDFNFYDQERVGQPMNRADWQDWLHEIRRFADLLGITFSQTHPNFYDLFDPGDPEKEWNLEKVRRGVIGSGILGAPWAVFHVGTVPLADGGPDDEASFEANLAYLKPLLCLAQEHGTGLALENLGRESFARNADNLIRLVDALEMPNVGVCWDFGHAHMQGEPQRASLLKLGKRLKATHVADNHGLCDEHIPPFFGTIDWREAVQTLRDIGYEGDFTYEIQNITRTLPEAGRDTLLRYFVELGGYVMGL